MRIFPIILILFCSKAANATTYYVKAAGGTGTGLSDATAWSFSYLAGRTFVSGDSVLLKRGDTFTGTLIPQSNVIYSAYGTGPQPIISGLATLTSWTSIGGGKYEKTISSPPTNTLNMVLFDGVLQPIGRYPKTDSGNASYINITSSSATNTLFQASEGVLKNTAISSLPSFVGGEVVQRTYEWLTDRGTVTAQAGDSVRYNAIPAPYAYDIHAYAPQNNHGFFFQNHVNCLTALGDWSYNQTTKKITMYFGAGNPTTHTIQVATVDSLCYLRQKTGVTIRNITFTGANEYAILLDSATTCTFKNLSITNIGINGIGREDDRSTRLGTHHITVDSCEINNVLNNGINGTESANWTITNTHLDSIGMVEGMGRSGEGQYMGMYEIGANSLIENNHVEWTGYDGIYFSGNNTIVRYNHVHNYCAIKIDGGGIYTYGATGTNRLLYKNIVHEGKGNHYGLGLTEPDNPFQYGQVHGLYMDGYTTGVTLRGNSSFGNDDSGMWIGSNGEITADSNTLYDNKTAQLRGYDVNRAWTNIVSKRNILFAKAQGQRVMHLDINYPTSSYPQFTSDSNYMCRPIWEPFGINANGFSVLTWDAHTDGGVIYNLPDGKFKSLDVWKTYSGKDAATVKTYTTVTDTSKIRFEYNATGSNTAVNFEGFTYKDPAGVSYSNSATLAPYSSLVLLNRTAVSSGQTYYVKAAGGTGSGLDDANAWSYAKYNSMAASLSSTDSVKFKAGDTFYGELITRSGVVYTSYGTGAKPVISGFTTLSSWTSLGSNLYRASLNTGQRLNMLTVNGAIVAPGRFPNYNTTDGGYMTVTAHTPTTGPYQNVSSTVTVSGTFDNNYTGGEIAVRKNSYTFDRAAITNHSGNTLTYVSPSANEQSNGYGIFVQNHIGTLDVINEWFYAVGAQTLTIYGNPAGKVVKASTVETLVSLNGKSNVKFIGLAFEGSDSSTFHIYGGSSNNSILSCDLNYNFEAISTFDGESQSGLLVQDCNIRQSASSAIQMYGTNNTTIRSDSVLYSNTLPGLPRPVQSSGYNTCYLQGSNNLIEYNFFIHSGGPSVSFNGGNNNIIQNNFIQDYCNIICDFGGIYTNAPASGNIIRKNIVLDGVGGYFGTDIPFYHSSNGIYADEIASGLLIENNVVSRMSANGIYIHVSDNITVRGNLIYDCALNSISQSDDEYSGTHENHDNRLTSNILVAKAISQGVIYMNSNFFTASDIWAFGYNDSNIVARPFMPAGTYNTSSESNVFNYYDQTGWRNKFGWDTHGSAYIPYMHPIKVTSTIGSQLFSNSTISSTSGFNAYSPITVSTDTKLDGTALKVTGTPSTDSITKQRFEIRFGSIPSGHTYMVTFSMIGSTNNENVQAFWIDDPGSYQRFGDYSYHAIRTTRVEDTIYVTTNASKSNMSLVFEVRPNYTPFWVDNVKLQEVSGATVNIDDSIRLEHNATSFPVVKSLGGNYRSMQGTAYTGTATLQPYTGLILKREINASPTANAGSDISITLPTNSTTLSGSTSTDADGTVAAYAWQQLSGPNTGTFSNAAVANPTFSGLIQGTYSLRLQVTDNAGYIGTDDVTVTVNGANGSPTADAGPDKTITLPTNSTILNGSGTDTDGTIASYSWSQFSGPSTATFNSTVVASPTVGSLIAGTYVFRLVVTDNLGLSSTADQVNVVVNPANIAPVANAGADKTVAFPANSTTLNGSGSDADGTVVGYSWQQVSGPSTATFNSSTVSIPTVSALVTGTYVFRLIVTDNRGATSTADFVNVVVTGNGTPVASAGADITITLPTSSTTLTGSGSTDIDGTISTYSWTKISGPSYTINNSAIANPTISGLNAGTYVFQLTVTDNNGASSTDNVIVTVKAAGGTGNSFTLPGKKKFEDVP